MDQNEIDPIAETIAFWKAHSGIDVSPDDAREMIETVIGYFSMLDEWDSAEKEDTSIS